MEALSQHAWWITAVFIIGYIFIIFEHYTRVDKATAALLTGIVCWVIQYLAEGSDCGNSLVCLGDHISNISQIVFFLLGALAIVEIISAHQGFAVIADNIRVLSKRGLLWVMGFIAFFLSSVLDNLTTTIVMVTVLRKLIDDGEDRLIIGSAVVIAANAGGAWTPIGDVTTTMLWIGGQVSTFNILFSLFLPSMACLVASLIGLSFFLKGNFDEKAVHENPRTLEPMGELVFILGIASLVFVPVFKVITGLPPFMGMFFGLSILWIVTDLAHKGHEDRKHLQMSHVFTKMDLSSLLFFIGILLAIDALDSAHILDHLARALDRTIGNDTIIAITIGLASAVIDNVPLVAASMGMYPLSQYPTDSNFWNLMAYCAGTGGSILIIGSAAGVVFMGMEKVDFMWYFKRISLSALAGYFAGILVYLFV